MEKNYQAVTSSLKSLEDQIKQLLSQQCSFDEKADGEGVELVKPQDTLQSSLDYAKQLSDKVFHSFQSITVATSYLPHRMSGGANQAYQYAQEMYSTLKPVGR